ncbi:hypothetical protein ACDA63_07195 [Uliginosibacterium sp. sgz301328]|uniref:hypothetical protein n=1 Tax=Uliginosibacterium sp. sgz301328 TaxID=3243764 RepID=UPI00359DC86A
MSKGLVCTRSAQTIGDDGIAVVSQTASTFSGVVTSDNGDLLQRQGNSERIVGSITIHTTFRLIDGTPDETADVVTWQGRDYTVTAVNDYSHFGRGFVCAKCELIPLTG